MKFSKQIYPSVQIVKRYLSDKGHGSNHKLNTMSWQNSDSFAYSSFSHIDHSVNIYTNTYKLVLNPNEITKQVKQAPLYNLETCKLSKHSKNLKGNAVLFRLAM